MHVVFSAFKRVDKLPYHEYRWVASIVMHVFKPRFGNFLAVRRQSFHIVTLRF